MADNRGHLLPVYMLADESGSMSPHVHELNAGLASLHRALLAEPMAAAKVRLSVLGFSNSVVERLVLVDLRRVGDLPALTASGGTSYAAAFEALLRRIPEDIGILKADGYRVHRPAVFFMSDGAPNQEDWETPHRRLTDRATLRAAPNIIACGIGEARAEVIRQVATRPEFAFVAVPGADLGDSISRFFTALTKSVVESGRSLANGDAELVVERPEGFRMAIDVI
ncbi:hypothetical protein ABT104_32195 [Streptomyces mobaraensis]|uniref:vWA domain-containing protein n=1 Tax=Streptomyces mobaraensis TaxID=35621 RepID=UPI00331A7FC8